MSRVEWERVNALVRRWGWPGGIVLGALAVRLFFFTGLQGEDDILYSGAAHGLSQGRLDSGAGVLGMRWGVVAPMALLYGIAGVHAASLAAVPLVSSLALVGMAYGFGRSLYSEAEGRWAAAFVALLPLDVFHATEVHADLPQSALATGAIALGWSALRGGQGRKALVLSLAAGLLLGWAHLAKESAFLFAIAFLPWVRDRRAWGRLGLIAAAFAAVVGAELAFYGVFRGDALYRVHAAREIQDAAAAQGLVGRVTDLAKAFFYPLGTNFPYTGGFFFLVAAGLVWALLRDREASIRVAAWGGLLFLLLAFWPVSLAPYKPAVAVRPRVLAAIEVPVALLAARFLVRALLSWKPRLAWAGVAALGGVALVSIVRLHQDGVRYRVGVQWAHGFLERRSGERVVTDGRTAAMLSFLSGYRPSFEVRGYATSDPPPLPGALLLDEPYRVAIHEAWAGVAPPAWFRGPSPRREVVAETLIPEPRRLRGASPPPRRVVLSRILAKP
jgi:hypothetical protein